MSFNIRNMRARDGENNWEQRRDYLCDVIRRHNPDIMATQEAFFPQVEALRQALPEYAVFGMGREDGKTEGEHCALFVRCHQWQVGASGTFWFSETPDVPGSRHWTREHARICTWAYLIGSAGQAFVVYNVHLDHEAQFAREQSIKVLRKHIRHHYPEVPILVAGDFNMEEDNPALRELTEADTLPLRDTFRLLHPTAQHTGTFHDFTGNQSGEKIDFILASEAFETLESWIVHDNAQGRYPSDHFPLCAHVKLEG